MNASLLSSLAKPEVAILKTVCGGMQEMTDSECFGGGFGVTETGTWFWSEKNHDCPQLRYYPYLSSEMRRLEAQKTGFRFVESHLKILDDL